MRFDLETSVDLAKEHLPIELTLGVIIAVNNTPSMSVFPVITFVSFLLLTCMIFISGVLIQMMLLVLGRCLPLGKQVGW